MADTPAANTPVTGNKSSNAGATVNLNKMTTYIIVGLFSLLVIIIAFGAIVILTFKSTPTRVVEKTVEMNPNAGEQIGPLVPVGNEIIVNIPSEDGVDRYLKINATLEVENDKVKDEVVKRIPQIRDLMITILRTKNKEKIDEKEGKDEIRSEIINSINRFLLTGKVRNLYFEDFLIN